MVKFVCALWSFVLCVFWGGMAYAEWTPLINSNDFSGIRTDLGTAVAGIITLVLIVFGVMMMIRTMIGK